MLESGMSGVVLESLCCRRASLAGDSLELPLWYGVPHRLSRGRSGSLHRRTTRTIPRRDAHREIVVDLADPGSERPHRMETTESATVHDAAVAYFGRLHSYIVNQVTRGLR